MQCHQNLSVQKEQKRRQQSLQRKVGYTHHTCKKNKKGKKTNHTCIISATMSYPHIEIVKLPQPWRPQQCNNLYFIVALLETQLNITFQIHTPEYFNTCYSQARRAARANRRRPGGRTPTPLWSKIRRKKLITNAQWELGPWLSYFPVIHHMDIYNSY